MGAVRKTAASCPRSRGRHGGGSRPARPRRGPRRDQRRGRRSRADRAGHGPGRRGPEAGRGQAEDLERRVPHLSLLRELYRRYRRQNATVLAGHLAFRSFLFILPVAVLMVAVVGFLRAHGFDVGSEFGQKLGLSTSLTHTVSDNADQASRGWAPLGLSALAAVAVTGSGLLSAFNYCFAQAWGLDAVKIPHRLSLTPKFVGSLIVMVLLITFVGTLRHLGLAASFSGIAGAMVLVGLAFFMVANILPHRSTAPMVLPGSIAAPIALSGLQVFANYYLPDKVARSSSLYGSLGVAVAVLFYLYLLGNIIVGSALVNAVWWDHFHGPAETNAIWPSCRSHRRHRRRG